MKVAPISTNRLSYNTGDYILQEKVDTMGADAVGSARTWLWARFYHGNRIDIFNDWVTAIYTNLDPGDLVTLESIRAVLETNDAVNADVQMMLFEALVQISISNLWQENENVETASLAKREAQDLIQALIGNSATPNENSGESNNELGAAVVAIASPTEAEQKILYEGFS